MNQCKEGTSATKDKLLVPLSRRGLVDRSSSSSSSQKRRKNTNHISRTSNDLRGDTAPAFLYSFISKIGNNLGSWFISAKLTRHENRYEYTALEADTNSHERLESERKARQRAESACLHYLRFCPRYALIQHLNDIGSRVGKHWFVVKDSSIKTERLLTLTPQSQGSPIEYDQSVRHVIMDLFLALQHPYIYPILDLEFIEANVQKKNANIIVVLPFNNKGSLKDLIYKTCWHDEWADKYSQRSKGLPISQIQRLGRQILEALLFLHERDYSFSFHLHSGNVILQNGVARLSGLENPLLGFVSRIYPVIVKNPLLQNDPFTVDVICFGHILFEMAAGYELTEPEPSAASMVDIGHLKQVVDVLNFIFKNPKKRIPSVEELLINDFFRNIDLREMRAISLPVLQVKLKQQSIELLGKIKKHQVKLIQMRKIQKHKSCETPASSSSSSSSPPPPPPPPPPMNADCSSTTQEGEDSYHFLTTMELLNVHVAMLLFISEAKKPTRLPKSTVKKNKKKDSFIVSDSSSVTEDDGITVYHRVLTERIKADVAKLTPRRSVKKKINQLDDGIFTPYIISRRSDTSYSDSSDKENNHSPIRIEKKYSVDRTIKPKFSSDSEKSCRSSSYHSDTDSFKSATDELSPILKPSSRNILEKDLSWCFSEKETSCESEADDEKTADPSTPVNVSSRKSSVSTPITFRLNNLKKLTPIPQRLSTSDERHESWLFLRSLSGKCYPLVI
ncbi:hypothetical protein V9T40_009482 [Parthenolecanium corni]|uniref:Protein kinase domain-containing protein n=1 Tax=Parthenolecanium corni TaxID=536013 RepID=A0AAN9TSF0_9HEMI